MGLPKIELENLKLSAVLHDVGKIGIDDAILRKQARLDDAEQKEMMRHPDFGADIMKRVPQLSNIVPGILHHHERVDGKGYPAGLTGEMIPMHARIIAVADTYDAMTTTRPYRKGASSRGRDSGTQEVGRGAVRRAGGRGVFKGC